MEVGASTPRLAGRQQGVTPSRERARKPRWSRLLADAATLARGGLNAWHRACSRGRPGSNCSGTEYTRQTGNGTVHDINLDSVGIGSNLVSYKITW
jgi:hypothetical protein